MWGPPPQPRPHAANTLHVNCVATHRRCDDMANEMGKRYMCTKCGSEMMVTKAGTGELNCCGQPMQRK